VIIEPFGRSVELRGDESVFEAARREGVPIPTACAGKGTCGLCRVKVMSGAEHLPPINRDEQKHLGNTYFITKLRLACQLRSPGGDVTVMVPDAAKAMAAKAKTSP
jgi:ferredoxin